VNDQKPKKGGLKIVILHTIKTAAESLGRNSGVAEEGLDPRGELGGASAGELDGALVQWLCAGDALNSRWLCRTREGSRKSRRLRGSSRRC